MGCGPSVLEALGLAGWTAGRKIATAGWGQQLTDAGFELNDVALGVWVEFGELTIKSSSVRVPGSSLHIDPVGACIDSAGEASSLRRRYAENYSPLGMWSVQFRSYIAASGHVVAVGPNWLWPLGSTFVEALAYVVDGDGGVNRAEQADWLANCLPGR
ncbi:SUKH-3 domain-containing protein [Streptomyces sp. NBC_00696]|uniref:SUKH-3 domain-containing protein n=1 Tax=Streptomyces sp. NBC_00696 TaxID=2903672 RepID=UPI002E34EC01|nr:SUKH-3 domain-containing protein [Streptomyces sp. NBC_00696]